MRAILVAMGLAMGLAACGGGSAEEWTVPCENGTASHDFGTTDLGTLGRVVAFEQITASDGMGKSTAFTGEAEIKFVGSVASVECTTGSATFVLEP